MIRQNCMILWDQNVKKGVITDPGGDVQHILSRVEELKIEVEAILLTHGHFDHVGVTMALQAELTKRQNQVIPILGPGKQDIFLLDNIQQQMEQFGVFLPDTQNVTPTRFLEDKEQLDFSGLHFQVLHIPGHTPGHMVFFETNARILISGDVLFRGTIGRTDFPYGDGEALIRNIKNKILPLGDDICILPGHGLGSRIGFERQHNPFLVG